MPKYSMRYPALHDSSFIFQMLVMLSIAVVAVIRPRYFDHGHLNLPFPLADTLSVPSAPAPFFSRENLQRWFY
jgi:hypothetical protein